MVGAAAVELVSALPVCSHERRGATYYVKSEGQLYYCDSGRYRRLPLPSAAGSNSLCVVSPADALACPNGGVEIAAGTDRNGNGRFDSGENSSSEFVCNGADGSSCSVSSDAQGVKTVRCSDGTSAVISDGDDGAQGVDGVTWIVAIEPAPAAECPGGGSRILAGPDADRDGIPDAIRTSQIVCNGLSGAPGPAGQAGESASLRLRRFEVSDECPNGGVIADAGFDRNHSGVLDDDEVGSSQSICDGDDALLERATVIEPGAVCAFGGEQRERGLDTNGNGELEEVEIAPALSVLRCFVPSSNVAGAELGLGGQVVDGSDLQSASPRFVRYTLDFGTQGVDAAQLSEQARRALTPATAASVRNAYAVDLLNAISGADLLKLDGEIAYVDSAGAHSDLLIEIQERRATVRITTANVPFGGANATYGRLLWTRLLDGTQAAQSNLSAADAPDKGVIVVFVSGAGPAQILDDAYRALPATLHADTIVILVETHGSDAGL